MYSEYISHICKQKHVCIANTPFSQHLQAKFENTLPVKIHPCHHALPRLKSHVTHKDFTNEDFNRNSSQDMEADKIHNINLQYNNNNNNNSHNIHKNNHYQQQLKQKRHLRDVSTIGATEGVCCSTPNAVIQIPMYENAVISVLLAVLKGRTKKSRVV